MTGTVGFIGLGAMGRPMASNLARKGFALSVYDLSDRAVADLQALGAHGAVSVAAVAETSDIVVTMLPDSPDVEAVVLGPEGVLASGHKGLVVMDMSTIAPATTDRLATALAAAGMSLVDAPVGRLVSHAIAGESLFMVGASDEDLRRVRPLLDGMGTTVHHCGGPGAGMRMKLVNNYLAIATCQVSAEALVLADRFGLDVETTLSVVTGTTATNGHLANAWPRKVLADDTSPGFRITLAHKDLSLCVEAARQAGVPMFTGVAARECLGQAMRATTLDGRSLADQDFSALLDHVSLQAGVGPIRLPA